MSFKFLTYVVWILSTWLSIFGISNSASTCNVRIGSCDYKLTLVPSSQCDGNNFVKSRSKRSEINDHEIGDVIMDEMTILQSDFEKLEKKLIKEMKNLSTRVLRGARRLETMASSTEKGHKKRKVDCPKGFVTYDNWNSCYLFSIFAATWYDARDYCVAMGSDLVALGSLQEHFLVAFHIQNTAEYRAAQGWWTSGTYMAKLEKWMWMSHGDSKLFSYVKWAVNEPNDTHDKNLQCVMMYNLDDLLWHDQICTDKYNFVCEIP